MGRFYEIVVGTKVWTSIGQNGDNPGAAQVQFDFFEYVYGQPDVNAGNSTLTIEGPALSDIFEAKKYVSSPIIVRAGMSAGLPLSNPAQQGLILQGTVFQAFANWVGTDMSLNFVVVPSIWTLDKPGNFTFAWQGGTPIQAAIAQTLKIAYPGVPQVFNILGTYANATLDTRTSTYKTLTQFATFIKNTTKSPIAAGIDIAMLNNTVLLISDGAPTSVPKPLVFTDLIGQPTWVNPNIVQFTTVLRGDLQVGSVVTMPTGYQSLPGIATSLPSSLPSSNNYQATFSGAFQIISVRQIGNFRDPNGASWATIFQAFPIGTIPFTGVT